MTGDGVVRDDQNGEEAADEDEGSGIFLPIWWPIMEEQAFYKDSDPEMQVFFKFEKDHKKKREVICERTRLEETDLTGVSEIGAQNLHRSEQRCPSQGTCRRMAAKGASTLYS